MLVDVGADSDFIEGSATIVNVEGREIGIVRWKGDLYAIRNICPHQSGPICRGLVRPRLRSHGSIGEMEPDVDDLVLSCPWHGWEFELQTGQAVFDKNLKVGTYHAMAAHGRVVVELGGGRVVVDHSA